MTDYVLCDPMALDIMAHPQRVRMPAKLSQIGVYPPLKETMKLLRPLPLASAENLKKEELL